MNKKPLFFVTLLVIIIFLAIVANQKNSLGERAALREKAEQGHADAQYFLGVMSAGGLGFPQDYVEADKWVRKAAEQEHAEAQGSLGVMFAEGLGVPQDNGEAVKWFRMAAEQGLAAAQFSMGLIYI